MPKKYGFIKSLRLKVMCEITLKNYLRISDKNKPAGHVPDGLF